MVDTTKKPPFLCHRNSSNRTGWAGFLLQASTVHQMPTVRLPEVTVNLTRQASMYTCAMMQLQTTITAPVTQIALDGIVRTVGARHLSRRTCATTERPVLWGDMLAYDK